MILFLILCHKCKRKNDKNVCHVLLCNVSSFSHAFKQIKCWLYFKCEMLGAYSALLNSIKFSIKNWREALREGEVIFYPKTFLKSWGIVFYLLLFIDDEPMLFFWTHFVHIFSSYDHLHSSLSDGLISALLDANRKD